MPHLYCRVSSQTSSHRELTIRVIHTDNVGEFKGDLQRLQDKLVITRAHTPLDTPPYNGIPEQVLGLLREKMIAPIQDLKASNNNRLWAETMNYACDLTNISRTTSKEDGISPYEKLYETAPALG